MNDQSGSCGVGLDVVMGVVGAIGVMGFASVGLGQSLNFDFGIGDVNGTPASTFAAAGRAGFWNGVNPMPSAQSLRALDGGALPATIDPLGYGLQFAPLVGSLNNEGILLDDFFTAGDVVTSFSIRGLQNGLYDVILYGQNASGTTGFQANGGPFEFTTGAWPGMMVEGTTHVLLPTTVTDGTVRISWAGTIVGPGNFNGMQLVLVPGVGTAGVIGVAGLMVMPRRRR